MQEGYHILEHPADMGIEAHGRTLKEVFEYAALGLVSVIVDPATIDPVEQRYLTIHGSDIENLLVRWLSEILYLYDGQDFLLADVRIVNLSPAKLEAILSGEIVNPEKHSFKLDVKAITYHQLTVEESKEGSMVRVFLDL